MLLNPILLEFELETKRRDRERSLRQLARVHAYRPIPPGTIRFATPKKFFRRVRKFLFSSITSLLSVKANAASISMPVNGCTVYNARLFSFFDACADFSAVNGRGGCTKVKGICPACVTYPGDHLQMWLPDAAIEVTPHFGRSVFAESASGVALRAHLNAAKSWAQKSSAQVPLLSDGIGYETSHSSFWHVRMLPLPFGKLANTFPPLESSKGVGIPVCYSALSELAPGQWNYGLADLPAAASLATLAIPGCFAALGAVANAISQTVAASAASQSGFSDDVTSNPFPSGCALPVPAKLALAKNTLPSSDAWNLSKLCIGSLGSLLPRTGVVGTNDPFKAALIASVKFSSMAKDHFGDSQIGGWNLIDKWQLVYPPSPHGYCFRPGQVSQALEFPFGVTEDALTRAKDNATPTSKSGVYIFLKWSLRTTCVEPLNAVSAGMAWKADYQVNKAKNKAICAAAQVVP